MGQEQLMMLFSSMHFRLALGVLPYSVYVERSQPMAFTVRHPHRSASFTEAS